MKIKYIFFDFDGVLAESVDIKTQAFRQMYLSYGGEFAQKVVDHHLSNGGVSRYEKFRLYNGEWLNEQLDSEKMNSLTKMFSDLVVQGVVNSAEVSGATNFLNSASTYKKYIITGTPTAEIKMILQQRKMNHFFDGVFGSPEKKDYWVKKILEEEGINNQECIFIGDALADYNAAISNSVTFILRDTKEATEQFKDYTGYRIKDLKNLQNIITKIEHD